VIIGFGSERTVICKACGSDKQSKFTTEIGIHFPGLKGLEKPIVSVFPKVLVCLNCGNAEFGVPEAELRVLAKANATAAR
jgi:hypothetical protein